MTTDKTLFSRTRKTGVVLILCCGLFAAPAAFADDACKTVICMFGKLTGNSGGGDCSSPEKDYFKIKIKKKGKINWGKTSSARQDFLDSCPTADRGKTKDINNKFGKISG